MAKHELGSEWVKIAEHTCLVQKVYGDSVAIHYGTPPAPDEADVFEMHGDTAYTFPTPASGSIYAKVLGDTGSRLGRASITVIPLVFAADETNIVSAELVNPALEGEQTVDGSVTPVRYSYSPPAGKKLVMTRLLIYMEGGTAFDALLFGNIPQLPNGWELQINGVSALHAHNNKELVSYMYDARGSEIFGKVERTMIAKFDLTEFTRDGIGIEIRDGEDIAVVVNDDLTGLVSLGVRVQGQLVDA